MAVVGGEKNKLIAGRRSGASERRETVSFRLIKLLAARGINERAAHYTVAGRTEGRRRR